MGSRFCLLILGALGATLLGWAEAGQHLRMENTWPLWDVWLASLRLIAFPVSLLLLGFTGSGMVRFFQLGWGLWLSLLTLAVLFQREPLTPYLTPYGLTAIILVLVCGLGLVLFSTMQLFPGRRKKTS
ncbi:MAG: hypothetical protein KDD51_10605 [Bdellovibrionales bacterium]|nr:hypothetical protein [Bdellovibrionales bacterium]